jgi:hypothetical protein
MTEKSFVDALAKRAGDFAQLVAQGAQWELKAHGVIFEVLSALTGRRPVLEFPYKKLTGQDDNESCDFLCQVGSDFYAIEVKVEGATKQNVFAGKSLKNAQKGDVEKLQKLNKEQFTVVGNDYTGKEVQFNANSLSRWFLLIAWSPQARADIQANAKGYAITHVVLNPNILFALQSVS